MYEKFTFFLTFEENLWAIIHYVTEKMHLSLVSQMNLLLESCFFLRFSCMQYNESEVWPLSAFTHGHFFLVTCSVIQWKNTASEIQCPFLLLTYLLIYMYTEQSFTISLFK